MTRACFRRVADIVSDIPDTQSYRTSLPLSYYLPLPQQRSTAQATALYTTHRTKQPSPTDPTINLTQTSRPSHTNPQQTSTCHSGSRLTRQKQMLICGTRSSRLRRERGLAKDAMRATRMLRRRKTRIQANNRQLISRHFRADPPPPGAINQSNPLFHQTSSTTLVTTNNLLLSNNPNRLPLAQLLRTAAVIRVQRRIEEVTHVLDNRAGGDYRVLVAGRVGSRVSRETEGAWFDELGTC